MVTPAQPSQDGPSGPLNPYQAPAAAAPPVSARSEQDASPGPLRFWEGRKALLKSLFYMRCFALVTALVALRTAYVLALPYIQPQEAFPLGESPAVADCWFVAYLVVAALLLALTLALSYVVWQFAGSLQQIAGRHQTNPSQVCRHHLLFWQLKLAALAAILLQQGVSYLHERAIMSKIEAMMKVGAE